MVFSAAEIAFSSVSLVLALAALRNCLTLDHIFSIGFKSGEYGGRNRTLAPTVSMRSITACLLCDERLSMTTISPGLSAGQRTSRVYTSNTSPEVAPSMAMQAVDPSNLTEEIIVVVDQWPCGASSMQRWPSLARPRRRVMFVLAPDSSMKTSLLISRAFCSLIHCSRAAFTSSRFCSLARNDFFCTPSPAAEACCE